MNKKAIGLDLGTTTLGIAYSDSLGFIHGIETFRFPPGQYKKARERVHQIVKEKDIKIIALGYPLLLSGEIGTRAQSSLLFKDALLNEDSTLIIELVDERLTTVQAHKTLAFTGLKYKKRKESVDRIAACEILDTYLRMKGNEDERH